jgi:hypothetical protein
LFYDLFSIDVCYFLCLDAKKSNQRKIKDGMIAPRIRPANASLCVALFIDSRMVVCL